MTDSSLHVPQQPKPDNSARRRFLQQLAAGCITLALKPEVLPSGQACQAGPTGAYDARLESFDQLMNSFVSDLKLPGAALAVAKDGRVVYARGFGYADLNTREAVQPAALFRLASISKPITAVAMLQLVERGKLRLDDKAFAILRYQPHLKAGAAVDPRLWKITIRHLLQHTAGWESFDPTIWGRPVEIGKSLGLRPPIPPEHLIRYMMGKPLDFEPGQRHAYTNFGYLVLSRLIESVSGQPYETYVRQQVLAPLAITQMRAGKCAIEGRVPGEVKYYDGRNRTGPAVDGPNLGRTVSFAYGPDVNIEDNPAGSGWIASAGDLVRFAAAFDDPSRCKILQEKTIQLMFARPEGLAGYEPNGRPRDRYYGCGWNVVPVGKEGKMTIYHAGGMAGTSTVLVHRWDGLAWALLCNADCGTDGKSPSTEIDPLVQRAADRVKTWPAVDAEGAQLTRRGTELLRKGEYQPAIDVLTQAIETDPKDYLAYNERGAAYTFQNKDREAIQDFSRCIDLNDRFSSAFRSRGAAYLRQEKYGQALFDFNRAIQLDPDYIRAYQGRSAVYRKLNNQKEADEDEQTVSRLQQLQAK